MNYDDIDLDRFIDEDQAAERYEDAAELELRHGDNEDMEVEPV